MSVALKVKYGDDIRRVQLPSVDFDYLVHQTRALYLFPLEQRLLFFALHSDGSSTLVRNSQQLGAALKEHRSSKLLKLQVYLDQDPLAPTTGDASSSATDDATSSSTADVPSAANDATDASLPTYAHAVPLPPPHPTNEKTAFPYQVSDIDYLKNEFHYHRLLVQTAVQEAFRNFREAAKTHFDQLSSPSSESANAAGSSSTEERKWYDEGQRRVILIKEALKTTIQEIRDDLQRLPPSRQIANAVMENLRRLGVYSTQVLEDIRIQIVDFLEQIFVGSSRLAITDFAQDGAQIESLVDQLVPPPPPVPPRPSEEKLTEDEQRAAAAAPPQEETKATSPIEASDASSVDSSFISSIPMENIPDEYFVSTGSSTNGTATPTNNQRNSMEVSNDEASRLEQQLGDADASVAAAAINVLSATEQNIPMRTFVPINARPSTESQTSSAAAAAAESETEDDDYEMVDAQDSSATLAHSTPAVEESAISPNAQSVNSSTLIFPQLGRWESQINFLMDMGIEGANDTDRVSRLLDIYQGNIASVIDSLMEQPQPEQQQQ